MVEVPIDLHVLGEEERLFQSLGYQTSVPTATMPEGGIIRNRHTVHLQLGRPSAGWTAHLGYRRLLSAIHRVGPSVPLVLWLSGLFASFGSTQLSLLSSFLGWYTFYLSDKRIKQLETSILKKKQMNENETQVQQSRAEDKFLKSNVRNPRSKLLHLALLAWLDKEDRHSKGLIRWGSHLSSLC